MAPDIKPIMQEILQARLDGKIRSVLDIFPFIDKYMPGDDISWHTMKDLTDYINEVLPCDNIPAARAFAEKYQLTIQC